MVPHKEKRFVFSGYLIPTEWQTGRVSIKGQSSKQAGKQKAPRKPRKARTGGKRGRIELLTF